MRPLKHPLEGGRIAVVTEIDPKSSACFIGTVYIGGNIVQLEWDEKGNVINEQQSFNLITHNEPFNDMQSYLKCLIN